MDKPIKEIVHSQKLSQLCAFPFKKCALLFTSSNKKDRTAFEYLKEVAKNFINEYQFYEIDLTCNEEFLGEIQALKKQSHNLIVYHPKVSSYVTLKAKLSKTTFQKFLSANLRDNKKLPFLKFKNEDIEVRNCHSGEKKEQIVSVETEDSKENEE